MHVLHKQGPQMRSLNCYDPYFFNRKSVSTTVPIRTSATASISDIVRSTKIPPFIFYTMNGEPRGISLRRKEPPERNSTVNCAVMSWGMGAEIFGRKIVIRAGRKGMSAQV